MNKRVVALVAVILVSITIFAGVVLAGGGIGTNADKEPPTGSIQVNRLA